MNQQNSPLFILQISDCHILEQAGMTLSGMDTEQSLIQTLQYAHKKHGKSDVIIVTGDLAQHPCQSSYQRLTSALEKYQTQTICLPGNHDDFALMQQFISTDKINCAKHSLFKHWQIICLNSKKTGSQGGYLAHDELTFLTETLAKKPHLNTLIAIHHHCLPSQSHWMDTMMIENSSELLDALKQHPQVKAVTCGHIHQKLEIKTDVQLFLGTPSSCFQFKPFCTEFTLDHKTPGYRTIQLYPDGEIKTRVHYLP